MRTTRSQNRTRRGTAGAERAPAVVSTAGAGDAGCWRCPARGRRQGMGRRHAGNQDRREPCRANYNYTCLPGEQGRRRGSTLDPRLSPGGKEKLSGGNGGFECGCRVGRKWRLSISRCFDVSIGGGRIGGPATTAHGRRAAGAGSRETTIETSVVSSVICKKSEARTVSVVRGIGDLLSVLRLSLREYPPPGRIQRTGYSGR